MTLSVVRQRTLEGGATNPENSAHEFSSNGSGIEMNKKIEAFTSKLVAWQVCALFKAKKNVTNGYLDVTLNKNPIA